MIPKDIAILLVEDSDEQRSQYLQFLAELGFTNVSQAESGLAALRILSTNIGTDKEFKLVITDYEMPQMNGLQLLTTLRQSSATKELPILYMSSKGDFAVINEFIKAKVSQMLVKPFTKENLLARMHEAWNKHHS